MSNSLLRWATTVAVSVISVIVLCASYVHFEHPAYTWDFTAYWDAFKAYGFWFATDPLDATIRVLRETYAADYNPTSIVPLIPFRLMFGDGRAVYITAIGVMYVLPAAVITAALAAQVARMQLTIPLYVICATVPALWIPSLRGEPDVVGIIFLGVATLILFRSDFLSRKPLIYGFLIGVCTYAPFMFRRWYAYSVVVFFVAAFLFCGFRALIGNFSIKKASSPAIGLSVAVLTVLFLLATLQYGLVLRVLNTSYGDLYSAYQTHFSEHLARVGERSSYLALGITAAGLVIAAVRKNAEAIFCFLVSAGTFFLFIRTQYMGIHHSLPVYLWLIPVFILGLRWISAHTKIPLPAFAAMFSVAFLIGSTTLLKHQSSWARLIIPGYDMSPLHLSNFSEYQRLTADLARLTQDGSRFVVYASSLNLSDSLLVALEPELKETVMFAPHLAALHGFPLDLLNADYAIVATPDQFHMAPGSQENILQPGRWIRQGRGFGAAYEPLEEYSLQSETKAFLYRRTRPVSDDEKFNLLADLASRYPDYPSLFAPPAETTK